MKNPILLLLFVIIGNFSVARNLFLRIKELRLNVFMGFSFQYMTTSSQSFLTINKLFYRASYPLTNLDETSNFLLTLTVMALSFFVL